jgi:hypothetical protein
MLTSGKIRCGWAVKENPVPKLEASVCRLVTSTSGPNVTPPSVETLTNCLAAPPGSIAPRRVEYTARSGPTARALAKADCGSPTASGADQVRPPSRLRLTCRVFNGGSSSEPKLNQLTYKVSRKGLVGLRSMARRGWSAPGQDDEFDSCPLVGRWN